VIASGARRLLLGFAVAVAVSLPASAAESVVVRVRGTIDTQTARLVERAARFARAAGRGALVVDVDSAGGPTGPALAAADAVEGAGVPTMAYVSGRAAGDATLVVLAADRVVMAPDATLGPVEPKLGRTAREGAAFAAVAARSRDGAVVAAFADPAVALPHLKDAGRPLVLDAAAAVRAGIAVGIAPSLASLGGGADGGAVARYTPLETATRWATSPLGSGLLLAVGLLGLLLELRTLAGVGAAVGAAAFAVFIETHVASGYASPVLIWVALAGLAGIVTELHVVPGHGLPGLVGTVALAVAVVLAFGPGSVLVAVEAIALAVVLAGLAFAPSVKAFPRNAFALRLGFSDMQGAAYVAGSNRRALLGRTGEAATPLRPAGTAIFDGEPVDVLTEGSFVAAGSRVAVVRVEGPRVFVAEETA